jgi:hypothetical protein
VQPSQVPYEIQIIQALGPTIVAIVVGLVAAYVAYRQWRTAQDRLRFDLFQRRFAIFEAVMTLLAETLSNSHEHNSERVSTFMRGSKGIEFLFDAEINSYLEEIRKKVNELSSTERDNEIGDPAERKKTIDAAQKCRNYLEKQYEGAAALKFGKYLSLKHVA